MNNRIFLTILSVLSMSSLHAMRQPETISVFPGYYEQTVVRSKDLRSGNLWGTTERIDENGRLAEDTFYIHGFGQSGEYIGKAVPGRPNVIKKFTPELAKKLWDKYK